MAATLTPPRCSIARTLEVLGEKWTLLVVREAFWGTTRFSDFRSSLGVASDILTMRLATLVEHGVMERRSYQEEGARERFEYHLTDSGRELRTVLAALNGWGDRNRPYEFGPVSQFETLGGEQVQVAFVTDAGVVVDSENVRVVRGTGAYAPRRA